MKSAIADEIRSAFRGVEPPAIEDFLESIMYSSADQEPVEFARDIYPCFDLRLVDRYKLDEILLHLSSEAYSYVIPRIIIYLLEVETGMGENFSCTFFHVIDIAPKHPLLQDTLMQEKIAGFYDRLAKPQSKAIAAAYESLLEHPSVDEKDGAILQYVIDFLKNRQPD